MTTKSRIEALREKHLSLLERSQQKELGKETLQEIETFLAEVRDSGTDVFDPQQRDLLRSFLTYWGNFVYEGTGSYPGMKLTPYSGDGPRKGLLLDWRAWVVVVVIGVLVLSFGTKALQLIQIYLPVRHPLTVQILQPPDKDFVPYETEVSGHYEGNLAGRNLWVIVHPEGSDLYYPQKPAKVQDKSWLVMARFGKEDTPEEGGKKFDISVYLASSQADQTLQEYVNEAKNTGNWPGIPLPSGLTQLDQVRVARQAPLIVVQILYPSDGDSVPYETEVSGRYEGNLAGRNLWVIVRAQGSDRYYPQGSTEKRGDNTWFVMANFGEAPPKDSGKAFDISVYLASSQADQKLREYVETGDWLGMTLLPDGLTPLAQVAVKRQ
jgi:hypothetical protein